MLRQAAKEFNVPKATIRKTRTLQEQKGTIEMPDQVNSKKLKEHVKLLVKEFYNRDEYSQQLPGAKDYVSIGKKLHVSKRLILCNLCERYSAFKKKQHFDLKVGFSKFANLRPKWCIVAGTARIHSVKLMLSAVKLDKVYQELIEVIVCSCENKVCMIHRCEKCPGIHQLENYLETKLMNSIDDEFAGFDDIEATEDEEEEIVTFKQWVSTDRADLIIQTMPLSEFITTLSCQLDSITCHSYIAKSQARYLSELLRKLFLSENLEENATIVLRDFAENYTFVIQDEIRGYHWSKQQCTLHPIVIYYKDNCELKSMSLSIISDDLDHDAALVYKIYAEGLCYIKQHIGDRLKKVHYFSDGCAGEYKNCKNFINLCHHKDDFNLEFVWNFFATSHGKSACDGIGGTVKRLVAKASLQHQTCGQIVHAEEMFKFCKTEIKGIEFIYISKETMAGV